MTLLPRKTSFRWKGISSLQAPKKKKKKRGERKKRKEQKSKKKKREVEREKERARARKAVESGLTYVRDGEAKGGGEKILTTAYTHAHPPFARTKIRVDYYLTPTCGFSIYFRRRVRNVYTGFALIGQGISHHVMKGAGWVCALK